MFDSGKGIIYSLTNISEAGDKPKYMLVLSSSHWFEERIVGFSRYNSHLANRVRIERLIRIWYSADVTADQVCVIDNQQYRVEQVQLKLDDNGLRVMELSLERLGDAYDIS
jgi:hypothetical protein